MVAISCETANHSVLYPIGFILKRYTKIYFGENQLSPGSFGMLPLTSSHPMLLLQQRVRASLFLSKEFTLLKVSSPGFGSIPYSGKFARLGHAFTMPSQCNCLDDKVQNNSPVHSSIGTTSLVRSTKDFKN